ncbi:MAG: hypothetical protein K2P49_01325, partial [Oscillospiraceae bacterium]|nr:hypothetical protein [Oscillospiraceae bacterium]
PPPPPPPFFCTPTTPSETLSCLVGSEMGIRHRVGPGDWVECRRSRRTTQMVKLTGRSFYERINQKLGKA